MMAAARHNFSVIVAPFLGAILNTTSDASVRAGADATRAIATDLWQAFESYHPTTLTGLCPLKPTTLHALHSYVERLDAVENSAEGLS